MSQRTEGRDDEVLSMELHKPARPMKVVVDGDGCAWLCDLDVDDKEDLRAQNCWRRSDVPYTRTT